MTHVPAAKNMDFQDLCLILNPSLQDTQSNYTRYIPLFWPKNIWIIWSFGSRPNQGLQF